MSLLIAPLNWATSLRGRVQNLTDSINHIISVHWVKMQHQYFSKGKVHYKQVKADLGSIAL